MTVLEEQQNRRLQDIQDALRDSVCANGEEHCRDCVGSLKAILASDEQRPARLHRDLMDFAKTLRWTKMRKGCQGCYPPYFLEEVNR